MFEEDAVTTANGHLSVALRIPGEADARSGIEEMTFHATCLVVRADGRGGKLTGDEAWDKCCAASAAALNDAVKWIASARDEGS